MFDHRILRSLLFGSIALATTFVGVRLASAQTNAFTANLSSTSGGILNRNIPIQYDGVILNVNAPGDKNLYVDSDVNIQLGGAQSIFTSMIWTSSNNSTRLTSNIAGSTPFLDPVQGRSMYIQNLSINNVALDPEGTVQGLQPFSAPVEIFFQPANGAPTSLTMSNAFLNAGAGVKGDGTPGAHFTLNATGGSNEIASWNNGAPFASPTTLRVTNGATLQFYRSGSTSSTASPSQRLYFGQDNNSLDVTGAGSTLLIDQSSLLFKTSDGSRGPSDFVVRDGGQISITGFRSQLTLPYLTLDNGAVNMALNTYLTPTVQLTLTNNNTINVAEGARLQTEITSLGNGSSTINIDKTTGVITSILELKGGSTLTLQGDGVMSVINRGDILYDPATSNNQLKLLGDVSLILSASSFNRYNNAASLFIEKTASNNYGKLTVGSGSDIWLGENFNATNNGLIDVTGDNSSFNVIGAATISGNGILSIDDGASLRFQANTNHPVAQGVLTTSNNLYLGWFSTTYMTIDPTNQTNDKIVVGGNLTLNDSQLAELSLSVTNPAILPANTKFLLIDHPNTIPGAQNFNSLPNGKIFALGLNTYEILYNDTTAGALGGYGITLTTIAAIYNSYWGINSGGLWTVNPNWGTAGTNIGHAPGLDGTNSYWDTAYFDTRGLVSGTGTVMLSTNATLTAMHFANANASYAIDGPGTIHLTTGSSNPVITNSAGNHSISTTLNMTSTVNVQTATNTRLDLGGSVTGTGGLNPSGNGTLRISGTATYSGPTTISGGNFQLLGTHTGGGGINVNGGTFSGTGSTTSHVIVSGGAIQPGQGANPGTLSAGSLQINTSGTFNVLIASITQVGQLQVSGSAVLGGTLNAIPINGWNLNFGDRYQVMTAGGGISSTFGTVAVPQGYRGRFLVENGGTTGILLIAPQSYTQLAATPNQSSVAGALNTFISATSGDKQVVSTKLDSLTASQFGTAFEAIAPTLYQSLSTMAFNSVNAQYNDLVQQMFGLRVVGTGFSMSGFGDNYSMIQEGQGHRNSSKNENDILRPGPNNRWGMFVDANGIFARANSANMLQNYNSRSGGLISGLTHKWNPALTTGIYAGYQGTYAKFSGSQAGSRVINNAVRYGLLATVGDPSGEGFYGDALVGGTYNQYDVDRSIQFQGVNRTAKSSPGAGELDSLIAAGYNWRKGNWAFGPVSSLQYTYFGTNSFGETGAGSLDYQGLHWDTSSMVFNLGANCAYAWQVTKNLVVVSQINIAWQHEFLQNPYSINGNLGGVPVSNTSAAPLRDTLYTGVGVTLELNKRWNSAFFYNAAAGNRNLTSQNIFFSLGFKF